MRKLLASVVLFIVVSAILYAQPQPVPPPPPFPSSGPLTRDQISNQFNAARARISARQSQSGLPPRTTLPLRPAPPDRLAQEINTARARLNVSQAKLSPAELNRLAETLGRSNYLAAAIVEAIDRNDFTNAAALLKEFPGSIDDLRQYGQPLLGQAGNMNQMDKVDFLLEHKASPDAMSPFGEPILFQTIQFRRWELAAKLVKAGASLTRTNRMGRTAPAMFFENIFPGSFGNDQVTNFVSLMLEHGLDPFSVSRSMYRTADAPPTSLLEECLSREQGRYGMGFGSIQSAFGDLLLTDKPSAARRTPLGDTALHVAAAWDRTNAIEFLLHAGFNIDQTNDAGLTPLQALAGLGDFAGSGFGNFNFGRASFPMRPRLMRPGLPGQPAPQLTIVDFLRAKGATLDVFSAAGLGLTNELAAILATNAALANVPDGYGRTPLHYAVRAAQLNNNSYMAIGPQGIPMITNAPAGLKSPSDAVALLLKAGANPSAVTTKEVPQLRDVTAFPAGTTPLHLAARNGNTVMIRTLLVARANAKLVDENGDSPLHLAARTWATNAIPLLLTAGAPIDATNRAGHTPLRAAVESRCSPCAEVLVKAGASLTNGLGKNTLLHIAAERGDVATAGLLLKQGLALEGRDGEGRTPLQKAAAAKMWDCLVFLQKRGADVNAIDNEFNTALHLLASQQDDSVQHLREDSSLIEWERKQLATPGWTGRALGWLIKSKVMTAPGTPVWTNTSLSLWLVEQGAKASLTNRAGQTPLHALCGAPWARWYEAAQASNRVTTLLNAGATLGQRDTNGSTALDLAGAGEASQLFKFMLAKVGPQVNQPDALGRTLLHRAIENSRDNLDTVVALLAAGAEPNVADQQGLTPLHLAAQVRMDGYNHRREDLVSLLLTNKANPNLADREGRTPLHLLFQTCGGPFGSYANELAAVLLTNGANPNATDKSGRTPLHALLSVTNQYFYPLNQMQDILRDPRWDFSIRDRAGNTPLHLWVARSDPVDSGWYELKEVITRQNLGNLTNNEGDTILHLAIRREKDQAARVLMQSGADPRLKNLRGETVLRLAVEKTPAYFDDYVRPPGASYRFFDSLRQRDLKEVNVWLDADPSLVSLTNKNGITPLMAATDAGNTNIINRLLELGAPLDALSALRLGRMDDFRKLLPEVRRPVPGDWLFDAVRFGTLEGLQSLVAAGGDVQFADADGNSLLFRAKETKNAAIMDWLSAQGCRETFFDAIVSGDRAAAEAFINADAACVSRTNRNGRPPLYRAAAAEKTASVALLLEHGAKADAPLFGGWTALHVAAAQDSAEIGQLLLKAGASPDALGWGMSPLHLAAAIGCTNMAELLLQNGADINLAQSGQGGYFGNTALHWAAHMGELETFKLLLAHGADLDAANQQGQTPLELARATARGQHWGFSRPPEAKYKRPPGNRTMFIPASRDAMIKQLEEAASRSSQAASHLSSEANNNSPGSP